MSLLDGVFEHDDGTVSREAFKKTFRVSVQNKYLLTPEIRHYMGTPTSGDKNLDKRLQEEFVQIMATPIACVEYYLMGAPIRFRNAAIPAEILKILRGHINNWNYIVQTFHNVQMPPMEDLDDIHEFCLLIVKFAGALKNKGDALMIHGRAARRELKGNSFKGTSTGIGSGRRVRSEVTMDRQTTEEAKAVDREARVMNFRKNFSKMKG